MEIDHQNQNNNLQNQPPDQGQAFSSQQPQLQNQQAPPHMPGQAQQTQPQMQGQQPQPTTEDPGKTMGIISLIVSLLGLGIVGLPLGIVAHNKSKKVGMSNVPAIIGIVLSILNLIFVPIFLAITFASFNGAQDKAKEAEIASTIAQSQAKAEEFYAFNAQYPKDMAELRSYMSDNGNDHTSRKLLGFDGLISYTAYKSDSATECSGQNFDCQAYEFVGDASHWNGDEDIVKVNR